MVASTNKTKNPIINQASFTSSTRRKTFTKNNSEQVALFDKTYQDMKDDTLRQNFHSKDKKVIAAMALATQNMAQEQKSLSTLDKLKNAVSGTDQDSKFQDHLNNAFEDIENGLVNCNNPEDFLGKKALQKLDNKKALAEDKQEKKEKKKKVAKKVKLVETALECEKKSCTLKEFKLYTTPKNEDIKDLIIDSCKRSNAKLINDMLEDALPIREEKGDELIVDLLTSYQEKDEYHLVGGHLTQFQTNVKVAVSGECGFGDGPNCPSIELESKGETFPTLDLMLFKSKKNHHVFENTDTTLSKLRLNPNKPDILGTFKSIPTVLKLLDTPKKELSNAYRFNLNSCEKSGVYHYADFAPTIVIHPKTIQKFSFSVEYDINKGKLTPKISYVAKQDDDLQKLEVSPEEVVKNAANIIKDVCGSDGIVNTIDNASKMYRRFVMLSKTDQLAEESDDNDKSISASSEDVPLISPKEAGLLPPAINFSYLRKKVNMPDKQYSEIGYDQSYFISGSPFFKYEKEVDLLNFFWRKSKRYAIATATAGFSEVALWASNKLELTETLENSFSHYIILMKNSVVKFHKEAQENKALTEEDLATAYAEAELSRTIDDDQVDDYVCKKEEEKKDKSVKASCTLKFSAAAETDDPDAGIVFSKKAGEEKFTYQETSMYAGINASLEGTLSVNMQILKATGFANILQAQEELGLDAEAGLKGQVTSADKTGESRFGVTIGHFAKDKTSPDEESGLCYQWFYSGLNVQIEAYIWYTKSETGGEDKSAEVAEAKKSPSAGRRGDKSEDIEISEVAKITKSKSLIDFCVFKAPDNLKRKKIKSIFTATGEC